MNISELLNVKVYHSTVVAIGQYGLPNVLRKLIFIQ